VATIERVGAGVDAITLERGEQLASVHKEMVPHAGGGQVARARPLW
jgi:hypothetical protein